jgi:hypothetical protein
MHRSNLSIHLVPEHRFQSVKTDFIQNFSDFRKKFLRRPEFLSLKAVFEMPKQEIRRNQTELSPASMVDMDVDMDVAQFASDCRRNAFLRLLLDVALHSPHARPTSFHLSLHSTQSNDLGERISDMTGAREHFFFWHGMTCHQRFEIHEDSRRMLDQFRALNQVFLTIRDLIAIWQPDRLMIRSIDK